MCQRCGKLRIVQWFPGDELPPDVGVCKCYLAPETLRFHAQPWPKEESAGTPGPAKFRPCLTRGWSRVVWRDGEEVERGGERWRVGVVGKASVLLTRVPNGWAASAPVGVVRCEDMNVTGKFVVNPESTTAAPGLREGETYERHVWRGVLEGEPGASRCLHCGLSVHECEDGNEPCPARKKAASTGAAVRGEDIHIKNARLLAPVEPLRVGDVVWVRGIEPCVVVSVTEYRYDLERMDRENMDPDSFERQRLRPMEGTTG